MEHHDGVGFARAWLETGRSVSLIASAFEVGVLVGINYLT
jgi:hypothetical protein